VTRTDFESFKVKDAASYDAVVDEFELFSRRLSLPLVSRMLSLAHSKPPEKILDVGSGTGQVALQVAPYILPGGKVVGVDLSDRMLGVAKNKAAALGLDSEVGFCRMDAESLAFHDESFDVVLSLFALLHFPRPVVAVREMFRVLRPGGRLVVAVGSRAPIFSWSFVAQAFKYLHARQLQLRGKLLLAPHFLDALVSKHLPEPPEAVETSLAHQSLNRTRSIVKMIQEAKFIDLRTFWCGHDALLDTPEEFWSIQRTFSSFARKRIARAPKDKLDSLQSEFFETCRKVRARGGVFRYPFAGFYVAAQRPR
jgi:ubiquinone/menaquinone biosynthesis C-methylase UbiE